MSSRVSFREKLGTYLNASYPLLWIQTHEENRVVTDIAGEFLAPSADSGRKVRTIFEWDSVRGMSKMEANKARTPIPDLIAVKKLLEHIEKSVGDHQLYVLKDFHPFFQEPVVRRAFRNMVGKLKSKSTTIIFVSPVYAIPEELSKDVQILEFSLPDDDGLKNRLEFVQRAAEQSKKPGTNHDFSISPEILLKAIEAGKGLTDSEAENAFTLALVENKKFDRSFVKSVFDEKVTHLKKSGLLTYIEPDATFDSVGGLDGLKTWIRQRGQAYLPEARAYGLPYPRGMLLCGVPGCGKTLLAKATSAELGLPLFQLDVGSLFGKLVGETEQNFRRVIQTVDGVGSCILFIDEIEKALNRSAVSGQGDTGTSSRSFGTLLSWLSDHKTPVFVIGTSNNFTILPPEMIRKGRFDELFWLDLPTKIDRVSIFRVLLKRYKRDAARFDLNALAEGSKGFTGAEIEQAIISTMFRCFADRQREFTAKDLLAELAATTPQSKINEVDITNMRDQAKGKLRMVQHDGQIAEVSEELRAISIS
ncbi:AAA family ATPase [Candidatus Dependentiae bacterium]|nr:MAG: AAA family ATPase [Candidatus Dependentiae bacterium]